MSPGNVPQMGERVRVERARRGLSVRGLAREIGVSASLISQIETGKSQPSVSTLYAITTALGISVEDLFDASGGADGGRSGPAPEFGPESSLAAIAAAVGHAAGQGAGLHAGRAGSEERRVGKECGYQCRSRWSPYH